MTNGSDQSKGKASTRAISVLVLVVTFLVGFIAGIFVDHHHLRRGLWREGEWRGRTPLWGMSEGEHRRRWSHFAERLELTSEQKVAADTIFAQRSRQLDSLRAGVAPEMKRIMAEARAQIDSLLTPEQRARHEELRKERGRRDRR